MARYHNKKETKRIGEHIEQLRKKAGWNIEDIAAMTGFSRSTISAVEKGADTDTSHLVEIAKAIGVHPKEILDMPFEIKSRYKLPQKRKERNNLTLRISNLHVEKNFFDEYRIVHDVKLALAEFFKIKADPVQISVILIRMVKDGRLQTSKSGRKNLYLAKKSKK